MKYKIFISKYKDINFKDLSNKALFINYILYKLLFNL